MAGSLETKHDRQHILFLHLRHHRPLSSWSIFHHTDWSFEFQWWNYHFVSTPFHVHQKCGPTKQTANYLWLSCTATPQSLTLLPECQVKIRGRSMSPHARGTSKQRRTSWNLNRFNVALYARFANRDWAQLVLSPVWFRNWNGTHCKNSIGRKNARQYDVSHSWTGGRQSKSVHSALNWSAN